MFDKAPQRETVVISLLSNPPPFLGLCKIQGKRKGPSLPEPLDSAPNLLVLSVYLSSNMGPTMHTRVAVASFAGPLGARNSHTGAIASFAGPPLATGLWTEPLTAHCPLHAHSSMSASRFGGPDGAKNFSCFEFIFAFPMNS